MLQTNLKSRHAFFNRLGGVSQGCYLGLNLSHKVGDLAENVVKNRSIVCEKLGIEPDQLVLMDQIHSNIVCLAEKGQIILGDGLVTNQTGLALVVETADCYPILLEDPINKVIGAVHAGWKGTYGNVVGNAIDKMLALGAKTHNIKAAIGPGICKSCYKVDNDRSKMFKDQGFPEEIVENNTLDLAMANFWLLKNAGIDEDFVWIAKKCTTNPAFFSYRMDKVTGRMWSVIMMEEQ